MGVERLAQPRPLPVPREIDMGDLPGRMDPGVGAAGAVGGDRRAAQGEHRGLERALDRGPVGLSLPADEGRAVIFERQFVAGHFC